YVDDIKMPGMIYARLLRSTEAHAKIVSIDASEALALPGVHAVITGAEAPAAFGVLPVSNDESAMAVDKVRHFGDIVAGVAADSEELAAEAIWKIKVEYEVLPNYQNIKTLSKSDPVEAPLHERSDKKHPGTNIHKHVAQSFGDVDQAFKDAAALASGEFSFQACSHGFTEPHSTVCLWDADDRLTCWSAQQVPHYLHRAMAKVFGLPMHRIRIVKPAVGGGFGGKSDPFPHEMVCALLSQKTRRPVKLTFDREEVYLTNRGRHPSVMKTTMSADKEGNISGLDNQVLLDGGAFGSFGVVTTYYNGVLSTGPYDLLNYRYDGKRIYTNKPPHGAMRGHGSVNSRFATETLVDELAVQLGEDPCEFRLKNFLGENTFTRHHKLRITSNGVEAGLRKAMEMSDWKNKWGKMPYGRGIGVGCAIYISGSALPIHWNRLPQSTVHLKLDMDGGVTAHTGAADIGQGSDTVVAQMVAEVLGIPMSQVHVKSVDSDLSPIDLGSYSSRVTFMNGNAARDAAEKIRDMLAAAASRLIMAREKVPNANPESFEFANSEIFMPAKPSMKVSFMEALDEALANQGAIAVSGKYEAPLLGSDFKGSNAGLSPSYSFQAFIAEVEVDPDTGFTKVEKMWAAHDCGRALNPLSVEGQIEGSIHMGIGQALYESVRYRDGRVLNPNLLDYKIPSPFETPEMDVIIVESIDPEGPFGGKECGEGALAPVLPAIGNAIYDAVGVRLRECPMTPEVILKAIEKKRREEG
ncbi:MAG: molybdopterin-dependent oxidoreductase, partial [Planctomycetes bacterium]|nr:molybdopterin-dependent oxidoreductase [Planctomycetota bacterium]